MSTTRRHSRIPYSGPVRISWEDERGQPRFAVGKCVDVSESGLRIEVPIAIPLRTYITLRADRINVCGTASVKSAGRVGSRHILGLELSAGMQGDVLDKLTEPEPAHDSVQQPAD